MRVRPWLAPVLLALGAALIYLPQLHDAPDYLWRDEMFFGLTAHSLASTGHDTNGRLLPLYFQTQMRYGSEMWFQPMLMYATALSVKVSGLTEGAIRLPMAIGGIVDVVLLYFIGRRLFSRETPAVMGAVLLALAPAHFVNSRVAMDFQTPLPFMLGWLLCLLHYLERGRLSLLFASGLLLGIGLYTYIASYMLMPIYLLLTGVVIYLRREPLKHYGLVAAGFILPALLCVPFLVRHPTVLHDVMWHYQRDKPLNAGADDLLLMHFSDGRLIDAASVYWRFWDPRFLFINGPQSMWVAGAFILPMAGLLAVGVWHAVSRRSLVSVLLLGGFLSAAIPASLVGDLDAIHRAAAVLPFGALLAAFGLDYLWSTESRRGRAIAFVVIWAIAIGLASTYHYDLLLAQSIVRAATVPLAVAGVYVLLSQVRTDSFRLKQLTAIALATLVAIQVAYLVLGYSLVAWTSLALAVIGALVMSKGDLSSNIERPLEPRVLIVLLAAASSHFTYAYIDYPHIARVGLVPATAILLAARVAAALLALMGVVGIAAWVRPRAERLGRHLRTPIAAVIIVAAQVAYFYIDYFVDYRLRLLHATLLLAAGVGVALLARGAPTPRLRLAQLTVVALLGVASIQFAYFYRNYFTQYRVRAGNGEPEGSTRVAWEAVIERASGRQRPAIYLGNIGPYGFGDLYWTFYALKHHREDLLARTIADGGFEVGRIRALPDTSLVVTGPSPQIDQAIEAMMAAGQLRERTLVTAPDGTSRFWILETAGQASAAVP